MTSAIPAMFIAVTLSLSISIAMIVEKT